MVSPEKRPVFTAEDKRVSLSEAAALVPDGAVVAIGGGLSLREPMALVRELIRRGVRDLHVVGTAHGIDVDLLIGAGAVAACEESYVGFEQDFGMAPNYRRAAESGAIQVRDSCCYTVLQQLRAAAFGVPFLPVRSVRGTDMLRLHPEYRTMTCPFTGQELVLVPALQPDVALLHAQWGDCRGNLKIAPPYVADLLFARAARRVIATVEELVTPEEMAKLEPNVPYFLVEAVVPVPFGAHPTSCYPHYAYDREHIEVYYRAATAGPEAFRRDYLEPFVLAPRDHWEYLQRAGGLQALNRLRQWKEGPQRWIELFRKEAVPVAT